MELDDMLLDGQYVTEEMQKKTEDLPEASSCCVT